MRSLLPEDFLRFRAELVLTDRAQRAEPILRDLFPRRAGGNAVLRVADGRVIDIAATSQTYFIAVSPAGNTQPK